MVTNPDCPTCGAECEYDALYEVWYCIYCRMSYTPKDD